MSATVSNTALPDSPNWRGSGLAWPARALVTAGMPYGSKALHFGHVGGVFVPADCFARFLRDRLGADNVCFVSGTDCFGSPINEGYRKLVEAGEFSGTIAQYVQRNHDSQKATLDAYDISLDIFEGSGIGRSGEIHSEVTDAFVRRLYENGYLHKRGSLQFYDPLAKTFLNGRQVVGRCPVQGCKSDKAYADECELGHQFDPEELIAPKSSITGVTPEMRTVSNWYFDLPAFADVVSDYVAQCRADGEVRSIVPQTIEEFLAKPIIFVNVRDDAYGRYRAIANHLPAHEYRAPAKGKQSFELEFADIDARDCARDVLMAEGIRIRTGKTLVPFRITGNIDWGVKAPRLEGEDDATVWCWPESLWAPISFTMAIDEKKGLPKDHWKRFWEAKDARVFQFIGQDNLYFYGVAQPALWVASQPDGARNIHPFEQDGFLQQSTLVANHHILYGSHKASSSGTVKPPSADELLEHYTDEQLRAHFLALALDQKSVAFKPKPFDLDEKVRDNPRVSDPALKEGALLTKVFNRLARSCLYEAKGNFDCRMPLGPISLPVLEKAHEMLTEYERIMHKVELHSIMSLMDDSIRWANKYWSSSIRDVENGNEGARRQLLVDCFFLLRICTLLMHPIVPRGTEKICEYLDFNAKAFFSWKHPFASMEELCTPDEVACGAHEVKELPPRTDFFSPHPSQLKGK